MKNRTTEELMSMKEYTLTHMNKNSKKIEELEEKKAVIDKMIEEMYPQVLLTDEEKNHPLTIINRYTSKISMLGFDIKNTEKELMFISNKKGESYELRRETLMKRLSSLLNQQAKQRKSLLKFNQKGVELMDKHINKGNEEEEPVTETNLLSKLFSFVNKNVDNLIKKDLETSK